MQAGNAHQVRVKEVDQQKKRLDQIPGPGGGGKVFSINLRGKIIEPPYGYDKIPRRNQSPPAKSAEQKPQSPHPGSGKIMINPNIPGPKGNPLIQRMIHPGNGNLPRKKGPPELEEKKVAEN
jgi:hypothetical protein